VPDDYVSGLDAAPPATGLFSAALPLRRCCAADATTEDTVKPVMVLTIAAITLGAVALEAGHQGKSKQHKNGAPAVVSADESPRSKVAVSISWGAREIEIVRRHYAPRYRKLPPGLQKKYARTGQLPPGWQKKMEPLPAALERDCAPLPTGYRRGVIDAHAVIYNSRGAIIDVAALF
jgi:hypothetical protein